jgi:hypothetical protein
MSLFWSFMPFVKCTGAFVGNRLTSPSSLNMHGSACASPSTGPCPLLLSALPCCSTGLIALQVSAVAYTTPRYASRSTRDLTSALLPFHTHRTLRTRVVWHGYFSSMGPIMRRGCLSLAARTSCVALTLMRAVGRRCWKGAGCGHI